MSESWGDATRVEWMLAALLHNGRVRLVAGGAIEQDTAAISRRIADLILA